MNPFQLISPATNLIDVIVSRFNPGEKDLSDNIVVFPGKRPKHFLLNALSKKIGSAYIPPKIFSIETFIDFLYEEKLGHQKRLLNDLDAVALLYRIHGRLKIDIGGKSRENVSRFLQTGMKMYSELEELKLSMGETESLRTAVRKFPLPELRYLDQIYSEFYGEVEKQHYSTRAMRFYSVAGQIQNIDLSHFKQVIIAGFYAFRSGEQKIFSHLAEQEQAVFFFQKGVGLEKHLKKFKAPLIQTESDEMEPDMEFYQGADTHAQVFGLNTKLQDLIDAGETIDEKMVIVLPSAESLFPVLQHTVSLLPENDFNISLGFPVDRTPVYGFIQALLGVWTSQQDNLINSSDYLKFLLHPYTKNIRLGNSSELNRIFFHHLEERFIDSLFGANVSPDEIEESEAVFSKIASEDSFYDAGISSRNLQDHLKTIHSNTIKRLQHIQSIGEFASQLLEILLYISRNSTAKLHPYFNPFMKQFLDAMHVLESSQLSDTPLESNEDYTAFFRQYISAVHIPFSGTPVKGLQVLGLLETRNLKFKNVFVLNADDDVLPGGRGTDIFLPVSIREMLGMWTYKDHQEMTKYYFDLLCRGSENVHLFFTNSNQKEKSRFIEQLIWQKQKCDNNPKSEQYITTIQSEIQLKNPRPGVIKKTNDMSDYLHSFTYSASALDTYLSCQLKFYYAYVLGLKEKEEISDEMDASKIGQFIHDILRKFFETTIGKILSPADLDLSRLEILIETEFRDQFGSEPGGSMYLLKNQIQKHLKDFVTNYQLPLLQGPRVQILDLEKKLTIQFNGFRIKGYIDRIEKRGDKIFILDYKTGSDKTLKKIMFDKLDIAIRSTWEKAVGSVQLPVYVLLYSLSANESIEKIVPAYLWIGQNYISSEIEHYLFNERNFLAENFPIFEEFLTKLLNEIIDPSIDFNPPEKLEKACPNCNFKTICGTQWISKGW